LYAALWPQGYNPRQAALCCPVINLSDL